MPLAVNLLPPSFDLTPGFNGEAAMTPSCEDNAATMPSFDRTPGFLGETAATTTPSFEDDASTMHSFDRTPGFKGEAFATSKPSFDDDAATMPLFDRMPDFKGEAATTPLFEDDAATIPSFDRTPGFKGEALAKLLLNDDDAAAATMTSFERDRSMTTTSTISIYKRHNPRAGKTKKVRGGLGSKRLFQRKSPPGPSQVLNGQMQASIVGSGVPCITLLPANPTQLKRKVRDMEAQALKLNDRVIELEVAVQHKNALKDKHLQHIRLLNEKNSYDRKACNLVSSLLYYS
jgi:hypothetical protein